ncbi:MAG: hypothetical protein NZR01_16310 [Bryobacteraceae bacterium]|nr:hypothetical protein [Bryobacteraceae bacterium]
MKSIPVWICAAAAACTAWAIETKVWKQSEAADFEKGKRQALALSSDGVLSLAPVWKQLADLETPLVWSLLPAQGGGVYAGAGDGKVYRIDAQGRRTVFSDLGSGAVYALAAGPGGALFAGLSPEGKVFRIGADGKAVLHAQLEPRYIWALVAGEGGALYAATGDPGQVVRIAADGKASLFFDAAESHVRALARDAKGNLIAGTEPGGAVLRIDAKGQGFVLHQTGKREVTALAVAPDGTVYAAAAGVRRPPSGQPAPSSVTVQTAQVQAQPAAQPQQQPQPQTQPAQQRQPAAAPPPAIGVAAQAAGSEIWRIAPDGEPRLLWSNNSATVYALALDAQGRLLAGAGSDGVVYRIDSPQTHTTLVQADPQQITALAPAPGGGVLAATANPGMVFRLGPELEKSGTLESEVLDAGAFTYWGRLRHEAELNGGRVRIETRSGNVEDPGRNWSPWEEVSVARGERIASPPARFLQYRAVLEASPSGASPALRLVEAAYQAKNLAPVIEKIEITPFNYRFPPPGATLTASKNLTLPALGSAQRRPSGAAQPTPTENSSVTMNYEKGWIGVRWRALDPNNDGLEARIEIRGEGEREWKLLKEGLRESRHSWDSTAFADGRYRLRITLSDRPDNYPGEELSAQMESGDFLIDNTPPEILDLSARAEGNRIVVKFRLKDALSALQYAELSVNGGDWLDAQPTTRITDSPQHEYEVSIPRPSGSEFVIAVRAADERDNVAVRKVLLR